MCNNIIFIFGNGQIVAVCYQMTYVIRHFNLVVRMGLVRAGHWYSVIVSPNPLRLEAKSVQSRLYKQKKNVIFSPARAIMGEHKQNQRW